MSIITNLFWLCKEKTCINILLFEFLNNENYFLAAIVFILFTFICFKESTWELSTESGVHLDCLKHSKHGMTLLYGLPLTLF